MNLYHYSKEQYPVLTTRSKGGRATKEEISIATKWSRENNTVGPYTDSISFFFDPMPSDIIGRLYNGQNDFWLTGNKLFEYVVETRNLEPDMLFSLVESPNKVKILDDTDWIDTDDFLHEYLLKEGERMRKNGETGNGIDNLENQIKKYVGTTRAAYIAASKRHDFQENIRKYAANVPHLMLYPKSGIILINHVNKITIGNNIRKSIKLTQESLDKPIYSTW